MLSRPQHFQSCRSISWRECGASHKAMGLGGFSRAMSASTQDFSNPEDIKQIAANRRPELKVVNWNVAAPNNNPFEYWAVHDDQKYNELMIAVQECIDFPDVLDVGIVEVFTVPMFKELKEELEQLGVTNLEQLEHVWNTDLLPRKAISGFLKDTSFGKKRLISMPDRMTNCIKTETGQELFRPSPITGSQADIVDITSWWALWKKFMFKTSPCIRGKQLDSVFSMLETIPRAKYPAISADEEALSVPLQTLCLALFDAIFTHLLLKVAGDSWQPLKRSLHRALFENKTISCISILQRQYHDADVIFVQEGSEAFAAMAGVCLDHFVLRASGVDGRRSQMSLILARKSTFVQSSARDLTDEVQDLLQLKCIQKGDLCLFELASRSESYLLASFHGDSEGTSTLPVLSAVESLARTRFPSHTLVVGLDANTTRGSGSSQLSVDAFDGALASKGLASCWQGCDLGGVWTTFNARTYLKPQLHKAVGWTDVLHRGSSELKDWIVFYGAQLAAVDVERDNTGRGAFVEAVMPSLSFPSDHALVAATLRRPRHADKSSSAASSSNGE